MTNLPKDIRTGKDAITPSARIFSHIKARLDDPSAPSPKPDKARRITKLLRQALAALNANDFQKMVEHALAALDIDDDHPQANHVLAVGLERLGRFDMAIQVFERAIKLDPKDAEIYFNLGNLAWRLEMADTAEKLFRHYISLMPERPDGYNNLAGVIRDQGDIDRSIDILREAIYRLPEAALLWNSLGTTVMDKGTLTEARAFLEEAIRLDPKFARAHHNLGFLLAHIDPAAAIAAYDAALQLSPTPADRAEMIHARTISLFHLQRLEEGFRDWEIRFSSAYKDAPLYGFKIARWQGEALAGRRMLVIGEQGLGDEIMFGHALQDIAAEVGPEGKLLIACERRLVSLYQRRFPGAIVGPYADQKQLDRILRHIPWLEGQGTIEFFSPMASTLRYRRRSITDFDNREPLLAADPSKIDAFRRELAGFGPPPYIGVCWKSLVMNSKRAKFYSPLDIWGPILTTPGATFINLQYGDCAEDLARAETQLGVRIHQCKDLDLKNDLDGNAALCAALDLVISAPNAASAIAGGIGTEVWFITMTEVWPQLGTNRMPWYAKSRVFVPKAYGDFEDGIGRAAEALRLRVTAHASRAA